MYTFLPAMMTHTIKKFFNISYKGIKLPLFQIQNISLYLHLIIHNSCQFLQHLVSNNSHFFILLSQCVQIQNNRNTTFLLISYIFVQFFLDVQPPETSPDIETSVSETPVSPTPSIPNFLEPNSRSTPTTPIPSPQSLQNPTPPSLIPLPHPHPLPHHHLPKLQPPLVHHPLNPLVLTYCPMRVMMIMVYLLNGHPPDPW